MTPQKALENYLRETHPDKIEAYINYVKSLRRENDINKKAIRQILIMCSLIIAAITVLIIYLF